MQFLSIFLVFCSTVLAQLQNINSEQTQVCSGMYNKRDWAGAVQPYISVNLLSYDHQKLDFKHPEKQPDDIEVSVIIFEYKDIDSIGVQFKYVNEENTHELTGAIAAGRKYICDDLAIENKMCTKADLGKFIINDSTKNQTSSQLLTFKMDKFGKFNTTYPLKNTGFYCVSTYSSKGKDYDVIVNFRNSFGNLSAGEIPKLPLYGGLTILYCVIFFYYFYNYYKFRNNVTNLQKNLNFFTIFLILETIFVWFYYELKNNHNPYQTVTINNVKYWKVNSEAFVKVYMVFIAILNSAKITFSFYLLLVISLGMGVVYPNLPKATLRKCQIFGAVNFVFSVGYIITTYVSDPEHPSAVILLTMIPFSISLTVMYYSILSALTDTTNYLKAQKQTIKLNIYKKLFMTIFISLIVLFVGLVGASFVYVGMSTTELIEQHWKSRFLAIDFWPSLVYFGVYAAILFIWRPTFNSYLLIVSTQVGTEEYDEDLQQHNDFELDNLGTEFDINEDDNDSFVEDFTGDNDDESINNKRANKNKDEESRIENTKSVSAEHAFKVSDEDESDDDNKNPFDDSNAVKSSK